ncbi:MAG: hypothetical protein LC792_06820 [Actinobacteria bacterium]|nr:hypothetical protein [Actinomycetota bacterium]
MRGTIVRIGVSGAAALLAVGLFGALPAGASSSGGHGKNSAGTTCFSGSGHTQGRSHSDPDGMSNGGADKPGCSGGFDADKDGNNGCGNDADREDDNNGNCGRQKVKPDVGSERDGRGGRCDRDKVVGGSTATTSTSTTSTTTTTTVTPPPVTTPPVTTLSVAGTGLQVAGQTVANESSTTTAGPAALSTAGDTGPAAVEATTAATTPTEVLGETISRPSALARTGAGIGGMALLGGLLCGGGRLAVLARRFLRID